MSFRLEDYRQWVTWVRNENGDKFFSSWRNTVAKSNDPNTWCNYDDLRELPNKCFVFSESDPFFGIDLDGCLDEHGQPNETTQQIIGLFVGVASIEVSQSGKGLHITGVGKKISERAVYSVAGQRIEVYDRKRFWIVTGTPFNGCECNELVDCQAQLDAALEWFESESPASKATTAAPSKTSAPISIGSVGPSDLQERARAYLSKIPVPGPGQRNNVIFSACGHLHAFRDHAGCKLSVDEIAAIVWEWCGSTIGESFDWVRDRARTSEVCGTPRAPKVSESIPSTTGKPRIRINFGPEQDDEDLQKDPEVFYRENLPERGIIREVFDYYEQVSLSPSATIGLATAVAFCEWLFGRRIQSESDLRTNDLNLIVAPTGAGKETAEKTIARILRQAGLPNCQIPSNVQSGNGFLNAIEKEPCSIWVKDEFGVYIESVYGKKKQPMDAQVGRLLLELYGKADGVYSGNAHASGSKYMIDQPHLVLLGMSTAGSIFESLGHRDVEQGTINRIAFWIIRDRPPLKKVQRSTDPPEQLIEKVRQWARYKPGEDVPYLDDPTQSRFVAMPFRCFMTQAAKDRFEKHRNDIYGTSITEDDARAAIWTRTAARSLKLAMIHWASCFDVGQISHLTTSRADEADACQADFGQANREQRMISLKDMDWGIKISNNLTRQCCDFVGAHVVNVGRTRAEAAILEATSRTSDWVPSRSLQRSAHLSKGDCLAAAKKLAEEGRIEIERKDFGPNKEQIRFRKIE